MKNHALEGEFIPSELNLKVVSTVITTQQIALYDDKPAPKPYSQTESIKQIDKLQAMLREGKQRTVAGIIDALSPPLRKSIFIAAQLTRHDLDKSVDELTGTQRHQLFVGLKRLNDIVNQLQKASLYNLASFKIGEKEEIEPPTEQEMQEIELLKQQRAEQQRQAVEFAAQNA